MFRISNKITLRQLSYTKDPTPISSFIEIGVPKEATRYFELIVEGKNPEVVPSVVCLCVYVRTCATGHTF